MKNLTVCLGLAVSMAACNKAKTDMSAEAVAVAVAKVSVEQLAEQLKSSAPPTIFDANGDSTREQYGTIPGAKLLESSSNYDVHATLPSNQNSDLVFYCANTSCSSAEGAAQRAVEAGYKKVSVLPQGIRGWVDAGQPTNRI